MLRSSAPTSPQAGSGQVVGTQVVISKQSGAVDEYGRDGRLTQLFCFDRHNRFNHHGFRVMAAGTSAVWALGGNLTCRHRMLADLSLLIERIGMVRDRPRLLLRRPRLTQRPVLTIPRTNFRFARED